MIALNRLRIFVGVIISVLLLIEAKLFYLQIPLANFLLNKSQKNFTRIKPILPLRGDILDCKGRILATNKPIIQLLWQGTGNISLDRTQLALLNSLQTLSGQALSREKIKMIQRAERYKTSVNLILDLEQSQLIQLLEIFPHNRNIKIEHNFKRYYPHMRTACHILGYLNRIDEQYIGKSGLEGMFQQQLHGHEGQKKFIINSVGSPLYQQDIRQALMGKDIKTTIDLSLQRIAEELFPSESAGAFLLFDPETGAVRALVSRPNFDPGLFLNPVDTEQWKGLQQGSPFLNRALSACYPPASIFKLVTMSAALEQGIISIHDKTMCRGFRLFCGRRYHCANRFGHGLLTTKEALAHSCNIMFFDIGKKISIDTLAEYAYRFGLGQKTGIIFSEKAGLIPTSAWKKMYKGEAWWAGETLSCVMGQSYLWVTPLQIARLIGGIFEGFLVKPRLLEQEPVTSAPLQIQQSTREFLQESMKLVVDEGTGKLVGLVKDIHIWAKTGTAETSSNKQTAPHAWFVAYFYYKGKPQVLVIVVEHTDALKVAVRLAKSYFIKYKEHQDKEIFLQ